MTSWEIEGKEYANCNCAYGCPCQFNALPTHGDCKAAVAYEITKGHHGDVTLDGLRMAMVVAWPGPIHEGHGRCQCIVDSAADPRQRSALLRIMSGEDTEPGATMWAVFASTMDEIYDPIFAPIDLEIDIAGRRGHIRVEGLIDSVGEPIRNPVTGEEHRARIDLPNGFEYSIAEMGSGTTTTHGKIPLHFEKSYGQFAHLHLTEQGVVRA